METTENAAMAASVLSAEKSAEKPAEKPQKDEATLAAQSAKRASNKDALQLLRTRFAVFQDYKPLAVGILNEVQSQVCEFSRTRLRRALHMHVSHMRYLKAVAAGGNRLHLNGSPADEITEEAVRYSKECLKNLKEKMRKKQPNVDKKKTNKPAARFNKQENAEKVTVANKDAARLQKLQMLAKKFGKKA